MAAQVGVGKSEGENAMKVHQLVDNVLAYLEASEEAAIPGALRYGRENPLHNFPTSMFDRVTPFALDEGEGRTMGIRLNDRIDSIDKLPLWPIDVSWCMWSDYTEKVSMQFMRFRTADPVRARRLGVRFFSPAMAEWSTSIVNNDGRRYSATSVVSLLGGNWIDGRGPVMNWFGDAERGLWQNIARFTNEEKEQQNFIPLLASWLALEQRYDWSVLLGYAGTPRVRLLTDPVGLREVFKLRDIPPGATRRAALKHWVRSHWRKKRKDEDATTWVKRHLRGAESFTWEGLRCGIEPAPYDLERVAKGVA